MKPVYLLDRPVFSCPDIRRAAEAWNEKGSVAHDDLLREA